LPPEQKNKVKQRKMLTKQKILIGGYFLNNSDDSVRLLNPDSEIDSHSYSECDSSYTWSPLRDRVLVLQLFKQQPHKTQHLMGHLLHPIQ